MVTFDDVDFVHNRMKNNPQLAEIIAESIRALDYAQTKHPDFPRDLVGKMSIMNEETGEATQLANSIQLDQKGDVNDFIHEVTQAICVGIRIRLSMPEFKDYSYDKH